MQSHKFPGDLTFAVYGCAWLSLWGLVLSYLKVTPGGTCRRIASLWADHGYTLYLWQNVYFTIAVASLGGYVPAGTPALGAFTAYAVCIFALAPLTAAALASRHAHRRVSGEGVRNAASS